MILFRRSIKLSNVMPPKIPPKKPSLKEQARVLFSYTAENDDELTIQEGDIINIIAKEIEDKGWMQGELNGKIGVFPDNFCEIIKAPSSNQTTTANNNFKNSNITTNNNYTNNNGTTTTDGPPELPVKKPIPENKLSKISSKFSEIISKSNSSLNESTQTTPLVQKNNPLLVKQFSKDLATRRTTKSEAPSLPLKKSKLFSTPKPFQKDTSIEVPIEDNDINNSSTKISENDLTSSFIDDQQNNSSIKLTHLTKHRVQGPKDRRPPSIIQVNKEDESILITSNSLNNISDLEKKDNDSSDNLDDCSTTYNKESNRQSFKNNSNNSELIMSNSSSKVVTNNSPTTTQQTNPQPPIWMVELKKTQAEKKNVEVKMKKNFSLGDESSVNVTFNSNTSLSTTSTAIPTTSSPFNGTSPNSSKKTLQTPNSPTSKNTVTPLAAPLVTNHRMSGDYSQRFKDFLSHQNTPNTNSLSRHSSVNNHHSFNNSSRTLSTDSLSNDCKEHQSVLGFGNLASPFTPIVKPIKAAKPTSVSKLDKFMTGSTNNSTGSLLSSTNNQSKDIISRKEFEELQKKVTDLTEIVENQKQTYKGLMKDLINDIAEEKKKVANLTIEVDRLRKLTTTV